MANSTAYGFLKYADMFAELVQTNLPIVQTAIQESIEIYQQELATLTGILVEPVTDYSLRYQLPGTGTLQPMDEFGNPLPVIPAGYYDVAFPIQGGGIAWGNDRISRELMTIEQANRFTLTVQHADMDWMVRHILAAIFTNTTWTYTDKRYGVLTIQPLANGDAVVYGRSNGTSSADDHYLAQAAAIADATNPYPVIYSELTEHPGNTGPFVSYIGTDLKATTMALATFVDISDPDITAGTNTPTVTGGVPSVIGGNIIGKADGMWIAEWQRMPTAKILSVAQGADPVVGMRQYPAASLQGLFPEFQDVDGNRHLQKFLRYAGFGVKNRVGAVVYQVSDASYDIPAAFLAPLAV